MYDENQLWESYVQVHNSHDLLSMRVVKIFSQLFISLSQCFSQCFTDKTNIILPLKSPRKYAESASDAILDKSNLRSDFIYSMTWI